MNLITRNKVFGNMSIQERDAFCADPQVRAYLAEIRSAIQGKRAIINAGLTIPEVMLGLLRENIGAHSKLYKYVNVQSVNSFYGRLNIASTVPEAVWTECCANLNQLSLYFNDAIVDCYKVDGYFAVCQASLEDSDLELTTILLDTLGQAIGFALDKAILYGRNSQSTLRMPQGVVTRLTQTEEPADYPPTARAWEDLHTSNVITIADTYTGSALFKQLLIAARAAKSKYAQSEKIWIMNEATRSTLLEEALSVSAPGQFSNDIMPILGGPLEILEFIPDDVIICGYFDLYFLSERRKQYVAISDQPYFIRDQIILRGSARYDGLPVIAEAFVAIGIDGETPSADMDFASDLANADDD